MHEARYGLIVCARSECQFGLESDEILVHVDGHEALDDVEKMKLLQTLSKLRVHDPSIIPIPSPFQPPILGLAKLQGWHCAGCVFVTVDEDN